MSERSGKVQTVLGFIDPAELGYTQPHEHLLVILIPALQREEAVGEEIRMDNLGWNRQNWTSNPENLRVTSEEDLIEEMRDYKEAGGGAVVELSLTDIARDPEGMARISKATGVHVIMGAGYYVQPYHPPEVESMSEEEIAEEIVRDVIEGVDGTGIKSGIIGEIGLNWPIHDNEAKVLRASARAQQETGAALNIHPGRTSAGPMEAMRIVMDAGGDPERTVMSHIDRTLFSLEDMLELAQTGCYLEWDLFGHEASYYPLAPIDMPNDAVRIDYIIKLIEAGYRDKLLISQDICTKVQLKKYGTDGFSHILKNVLPMMERKGMSQEDIEIITVKNPARMLTFK
ncbi:MAG: TatD family hydrolase [Deltaproteobacteria bacterium]|nr:TatD family hydrolase [Deltaproteobacteria bacterium]